MPDYPEAYPDWFIAALEVPTESGSTTVEGCPINFVSWGDRGNPGVILVHGSNAHLEWWRMIAPMLSDQFHVVAFDLSGAGASGWRIEYSSAVFASEVMAVAEAAGLRADPFVVGHSFGGMVALEAGHLFGADLGGAIMVDFTVSPPGDKDVLAEMRAERANAPVRPTRVYEDRDAALARFRLVPEQACDNPFLVSYLAEHSLREVEGGWTWKFDPGMFSHLNRSEDKTGAEKLRGLACPAAFVMAEQSLDYSPAAAVFTEEITRGVIPYIRVPRTRHHLMLDEPVAVAMTIKSILAAWQFSR
jgi:pimeloyl-ACP methyl ester carboxylesterase